MAKGNKLSEFEKGEIIALKRIRKSQGNFEGLRTGKTVICNYLKSPNGYGTRKPTGRQEKNYLRSKKENFFNIKNIEISCGCSLQY